jgi:DNA-binding transcriptional regulator GbsR (MarR family)
VTELGARVLDCIASSSQSLAANEIGHKLRISVRDVMIALHELEQSGLITSKIRGARMRRYYEMA